MSHRRTDSRRVFSRPKTCRGTVSWDRFGALGVTRVVCWHHGRRSISGLRLSVAIRTNARINFFFFPVILVRPECRRFAKAAVRAFVFPGINGQIVFSEMVICTSKKVSIALGAIANSQAFTGHLFAKKRVIWTVLGARRVRTQPREVAMSTIATPVAGCPHPISNSTTGMASRGRH